MKVIIDTNILIDYFQDRELYADAAEAILRLCSINEIDGYISALSIPNLVYIMRKELTQDKIKKVLSTVEIVLTIEDLKAEDISEALNTGMDDFEDSLQSVCAKRIGADYIITRNEKDFKNSEVPPISPIDFINKFYK